jgi:hypothetical protein
MPATRKDPPDRHKSYWRDWVMWFLVAAAFAVRIAYNLALHPDGHTSKNFVIDEREYFGAAHVLAEGRGFSWFDKSLWVRPPLYIAAVAGIMAIWGDDSLPQLVFQSLLSALTLPALGWLAFRVGGRKAARITLLLGMFYLPLTLFAGLLLSETLFVFLFAWSLVTLMVAREVLHQAESHALWRLLFWPAIAGLLLGLCVLTRSTALGFVPLAILWLVWGKELPLQRRVSAFAVVLGVCLLMLAPWVARNYAAYGRFIPVDTTGGYNLWLGSVGVRDEARLQEDLLAISNPGDRQSFALSQALANIGADPLKFIGKGIKESFDLWLPSFGAEERQVRGYALGRIPGWHLVSLFLFDDLLYLVILLMAVTGFALAPPHPFKSLTGLWVLLWVGTSFIFFAVTRFRLPIVACLIPWAGVGISLLSDLRSSVTAIQRRTQVAAAVTGLAILVVIVPVIPAGDTWLGIERWGQQAPYQSAESLLRAGKPEQAIAEYNRANVELSDTRYGLAAALIQLGRSDEALAQLRSDDDPDRPEPFIIRGEVARKAGNLDAARSSFNARPVHIAGERALDWAWDHIVPTATSEIQLGSGLDMGYIRGFYAPEKDKDGNTFRWTSDKPQIRWSEALSDVSFTWNGWRPTGNANVVVDFLPSSTGSRGLVLSYAKPFTNIDSWGADTLSDLAVANEFPSTTNDCATYSCLSMMMNGFVNGGDDPRLLGIRISSVGNDK